MVQQLVGRAQLHDRGDHAAFLPVYAACGSTKFTQMNVTLPEDRTGIRRNLLAGHKAGRDAIKTVRPDLSVGVSLAIIDQQAVGQDSLRDAERAQYDGAWLELVKGDDFVGVQNCERQAWDAERTVAPPVGAPKNLGGGEGYPTSLANAVRYGDGMTGRPILFTEQGIQTKDDAQRVVLILAALTQLRTATGEGVPVLGYLHWSLLDNFEWNGGFAVSYGLYSVDRTTFRRTAKSSAGVLGDITRRNAT